MAVSRVPVSNVNDALTAPVSGETVSKTQKKRMKKKTLRKVKKKKRNSSALLFSRL